MANLTIVGINYPPELTGIAPYTAALTERALARGHRVTVLAGLPSYPQWRIADGHRRLYGRSRRKGADVVRAAHYVPRRQSAISRAIYEGTFLLTSSLALPFTRRPDALVGIVPALADAVAVAGAALIHRAPYALLFQDLMGPAAAQSGIDGGGVVARATATLEQLVARRATAVGVVSPAFEPYLVAGGVDSERIVHVPNWSRVPPPGDRMPARAAFGWSADEVVVLHAGNIGLKQGLEQVIEAAQAAATARPDYRFVFVGDGNQRSALEAAAARLPNVRFLGLQPDDIFAGLLRAADVLLLSERESTLDMSLPSKLTSYYASGRPILAAIRPDGATAAELRASGGGLIVPAGQPDALLAGVDRLVGDRSFAAGLIAAARRHVATALGEDLALQRLDALLDRLLPGRQVKAVAA